MMETLGWVLFGLIVTCYVSWVILLAVQPLMLAREHGRLPHAAWVMFYPALYTMLLLQFLLNVFVLTIILGELPREWLAAQRLRRLSKGKGLQARIARLILRTAVDPFVVIPGQARD